VRGDSIESAFGFYPSRSAFMFDLIACEAGMSMIVARRRRADAVVDFPHPIGAAGLPGGGRKRAGATARS
jgi:hypothetical protein